MSLSRRVFNRLFAAVALSGAVTACARSDEPQIGGPFHLVDQNGRPADQSLLKGKWTAVFFGYIFCPDICPATMQTLGSAQPLLGDANKDFQVVFISVDPDRDTPARMKAYLAAPAFPKGATGLTGTPAQVADVARAYHVYYQKAPDADGAGYAVQHSSAIYLMNPKGRFDRPIQFGLSPKGTADEIRAAMTA